MANTDVLARLHADLKVEHRQLDEEIARGTEDASFNLLDLQRLKKRKLALRDRITNVSSRLLPDIIA